MRTKAAKVALVGLFAIGLVSGTALAAGFAIRTQTFQALAPTPPYQLFLGPPRSAIFTNLTGEDAVGLQLIFSSAVPSLSGYGIASDATLVLSEGLMATFEGDIPNYGGVYAEWDETDAKVLVAQWLLADGSTLPVNLHQPFARMMGTVTYSLSIAAGSLPLGEGPVVAGDGFITPQIEVMFDLDGSLSTTFDGTDIVRYKWEWDDGVMQEGPTAERTILMSIDVGPIGGRISHHIASVTLTVWGLDDSSSSVTKSFVIRALFVGT